MFFNILMVLPTPSVFCKIQPRHARLNSTLSHNGLVKIKLGIVGRRNDMKRLWADVDTF